MSYGHTLIPIRERSFLNLLDLSLLLVRRHPLKLGLSAAAGIVPIAIVNAWIFSGDEFPGVYTIPLLYMEAPWACLPLTLVLGGLMFGQPPSVRIVVRRIIHALPALVLVYVFIRGALCLTGFLIPLIPGRFWFASEVILLERARAFAALGRCGRLTRDRSGEFFMQWIGQCFFGLAFILCFRMGAATIISALFESELTWEPPATTDIQGPLCQLGIWIAIAFFSVARFLNYIDQRIRSEGWELRLQLQAAAAEARKGAA